MDFTGMDKKTLEAFIEVHESLARASSRDGEILQIIKDLEAEVRALSARISALEDSK